MLIIQRNINLFINKFGFAEEIIQVFVIFLVSESKLDNTFPANLFKINGYKIFKYDRNRFGAGLFLYVNERVPCRLLQGLPNVPNIEFEFYILLQFTKTIENCYFWVYANHSTRTISSFK